MSSDDPGWNEPEYRPPNTRYTPAADRVRVPAVFLIILAVINILLACVFLCASLFFHSMSQEEFNQQIFEKALKAYENAPELQKALKETAPEEAKAQMTNSCVGWGVAILFTGAFILFGGIRMLALRSYGMAVVGALLAAIPCISCSACCGFGEGIGIWALVVLLNSDVRAAFR